MVAEVSGRRLGHIVLEPGSPSSKPLRPAEMTKRDVPGFAIGGLSGGESKAQFWRMVELSTSRLPKDKPRYLMGVGYAGHPQMDTSLPGGGILEGRGLKGEEPGKAPPHSLAMKLLLPHSHTAMPRISWSAWPWGVTCLTACTPRGQR